MSEDRVTYEDLKTDSTKTLSALMWIHAMKASLKFTFSHRTSGPCRLQVQIKVESFFVDVGVLNLTHKEEKCF